MYNRHNFHKHTFCIFTQVSDKDLPAPSPNYKSKSGSEYYFTEDGVYRRSNHWGRAANCKWRLQGDIEVPGRTKAGYAGWNEFHPDNESEKLYYIAYDEASGAVTYQHKSNREEGNTAVLRTVSGTMKVIKEIRSLLKEEGWARHYPLNVKDLRRQIIGELVHTEKNLRDIKTTLLSQ